MVTNPEEDMEERLDSTTDYLASCISSKIIDFRGTSSDMISEILRSLISLGYFSELEEAISDITREGLWRDTEEDSLWSISSQSDRSAIIDMKYV
jgi:hypothetical protein